MSPVVKKNNLLQLQVDAVSEHSVGPKQSRLAGAKHTLYLGGPPGEHTPAHDPLSQLRLKDVQLLIMGAVPLSVHQRASHFPVPLSDCQSSMAASAG